MLLHSHSTLIFFLLLPAPLAAAVPRRNLHQPFFPAAPPPSLDPPPSPPFFPSLPSTPPVLQPTFPALVLPSPSPPRPAAAAAARRPNLLAILLPILFLSVLLFVLSFLLFRRRRRRGSQHQLGRPKLPKPAASGSSFSSGERGRSNREFLYVGTVVGSRNENFGPAGSPELRPLPPLLRTDNAGRPAAAVAAAAALALSSEEEEFYSPRDSSGRTPAEKAHEVNGSSMVDLSPTTVSTPSYPSSRLGSPPPATSGLSSPIMISGRKDSSVGAAASEEALEKDFVLPPPAPPPLPPKRKPPSPSPPPSPPPPAAASRTVLSLSWRPPAVPAMQKPVPKMPPPPPPPPVGYWESKVGCPKQTRSPALSPPPKVASFEGVPSPAREEETTPRPKLKPLHWDKVPASSERATVWDQLRSSSFKVNEEMIETLFVCKTADAAGTKETARRPVLPAPARIENQVLDAKKAQNIAILLRALNVTKEEVCDALLEGNTESLGAELLETLLKMAPTKEEEIRLREYKEEASPSPKLGPAEKFLKAVLDVPFAFKRVDAMLYIANFDAEVNYLKKSFETLEAACEELRTSRLFLKLLEAVLKTGNRMNVGTYRGDAHAFKLDTLLKLVDVKGTDGKTTLLHFVVQEIIRSEGSRLSSSSTPTPRTQANPLRDELECKKLGLQVVAGLGNELSHVKKAAAMDSDVLSSYVSKLAGGVAKINDVVRLNDEALPRYNGRRFCGSMNEFMKKAEDEIIRVQAQESVALSLVKEITEYFHGDSAKEEAHPFRIFMVVRDFLSTLDQVCREVGRMNDRSIASSSRQFPVPVNPMLPAQLFPRLAALRPGSSDDESSS